MRIVLNDGFYRARSVIASAQRAVNIYAESNPKDSEVEFTHYNAPGLTSIGAALNLPARCLYWANNGTLFYCAGQTLYTVGPPPTWTLSAIGTIGTTTGFVSMADNGTTMVLVDGSGTGYQYAFTTGAFTSINEAANGPPAAGGAIFAFYGADRVDVLDGFLVFNQPGTQNFYCTYNNEVVFDATYFAEKNGYSDGLVTVIVTRREIWLIGQRTTEIWFDAGNPTFPFAIMPGPFIQHGCSAKWTVAQIDGVIFWLSQDQAGQNILARGEGYLASRISTHAIEAEWATYTTVSDAQAFCFQLGGHSYYQINFPSADKSWRWDETTKLWHEVAWTDSDGADHRHRAACAVYAYGSVVAGDWQTGQLYVMDPDVWTDAGAPMYFRRGFPHMMQDGKRVIYPSFTLDIEAATSANTIQQPGPFMSLSSGGGSDRPGPAQIGYGGTGVMTTGATSGALLSGPAPIDTSPQVLLRWSDDRGRTWSNSVPQSLGATGQYLKSVKWWRTGMARDRVFEVHGVVPGRLAINGAFLDAPITMKT